MDVPTRLTITVPVDGADRLRLHLRESVAGPTVCGIPVLDGDRHASSEWIWTTGDGSACRECMETVDGLSDAELLRWSAGGGIG